MRAFVSGAAGFVGQALVVQLLENGYHVTTFDLPKNPIYTAFAQQMYQHYPKQLTVAEGDVTRLEDIQTHLKESTLVFHTAALLNSIANKAQFYAVNVLGTENMCEASVQANATRFVLISTSDVFGIPPKDHIITEKTTYSAWNEPYADTKIEACNVVKRYQRERSLPTTIIYPGWIYGPGDKQFFPAIIDMVNERNAFVWHKAQPCGIDLIYISDLVVATLKAATSNIAVGQDYLVLDNSSDITPERLFQIIATKLEVPIKIHKIPYIVMYCIASISQFCVRIGLAKNHLLSTTDVKAFGNDFSFSNKKAKADLEWSPSVTSEEGIQLALNWQIDPT